MTRINKRLIKYFIGIITFVVFVCFVGSSLFLSRFYMKYQYNLLENNAKQIYKLLKEGLSYQSLESNAIIINDGQVNFIGKSRMGIMPFLRSVDYNAIDDRGKFKAPNGETFLYFKLKTDLGDIVVFKNSSESSEYLSIVYIILGLVFSTSIILCIPIITYLGNKFTKPMLKLQSASKEIAKGNFNVDMEVSTNDEIEDLSLSLRSAAGELERKYSMQRDFIANVSHDFRTPLAIIRNYAEAISDNLVTDTIRDEYAKEIMSEVDRLNTMVGDIMQLSKLKEGANLLKKEWFDLGEFLKNCIDKFSKTTRQKRIEIISNELNVSVYGDINYLSRVIYNFIDNGLKFSKEDSRIEVIISVVSGGIKVSVKDQGIGIEKDSLNEIWDRYHKHSQSGGMGLGLPISSEILKLHGFLYGVESKVSNGSEFYFIIPEKLYRDK